MMTNLWNCFAEVVQKNKLQFCENGEFILKGGKNENKYKTTILSKNNNNIVVFDVGDNSHAPFVASGYDLNCDYIFVQINSDNVSFILCELKKSNNNAGKAYRQLKCSTPLMHYLRQLLITHCRSELEDLKIKHKKVLIINDMSQKTPIKNQAERDDDVYIFHGEEFSSNELFDE